MKHKNPRKKMSTDEFIQKANKVHNEKYNYSQCNYIDYFQHVQIICNECENVFSQTPSNHLAGRGCKKCRDSVQRMTTADFIELAIKTHGDEYDYTNTKYTNAKTKVEIKCKKCLEIFSQLPRGHIYEESGCPKCRQSHGEKKISLMLKLLNIKYQPQKKFNDCRGIGSNLLRFDFYLPELNTCIEYDGKQHTDTKSKYWNESICKNDTKKDEYCKQKNIKMVRINFTEFEEITSILESHLLKTN